MFTVPRLSLCSAQFIFTKVMRGLVKFSRREGIKLCVYIDDDLEASSSLDLAMEEVEFVRNSLTQCGFFINFEKSIEQSQKELIWMEIKKNLINSHFTITKDRIVSIMESIQVAIKKLPFTTA